MFCRAIIDKSKFVGISLKRDFSDREHERHNMEENMKNRIAITLKDMLVKYGPDKITVAKLVEECQISRSLFYYYFTDVFDVMVYHLEKDLDSAVAQSLKENVPEVSLHMFLDSIMFHRQEIDRIMSSKYREQAEREMMSAAEKYARQLIEGRFLNTPVTPEELRYLIKSASYVIFGFVMDNRKKADPDTEAFSRHIIRFSVAQTAKTV